MGHLGPFTDLVAPGGKTVQWPFAPPRGSATIPANKGLREASAPAWCSPTARAVPSASGRRAAAGQRQGHRGGRIGDGRQCRERSRLKSTPVLMLFGDYVDEHPRWATFKKID